MWLCWELWIHRLSETQGTHQLLESCCEYCLFAWKQMRSSRAKNWEVLCFYVLSLPRRMATRTHALSMNHKLSHMISDRCNMKSAYWSVLVLLSSVSESAVASTPLRKSLFPRCQDCEQLISTGCDGRHLFPEIVDAHSQHAYPVSPCPLYYAGSEWNEMLT